MMGPENNLSEYMHRRLECIQRVEQKVEWRSTEELASRIAHARAVFVTGCGRSGLVGRSFAMRLMQMGFATHVAGETTCPRISETDLLVAFSFSGTTTTTVELAGAAVRSGAEVAALTSKGGSPLADLASCRVVLPVNEALLPGEKCRETGICENTIFEEAAFLYCDALVHLLMQRCKIRPERLDERHANLE